VSEDEQLRSALERIAELEREVARAARRSVSPSASQPANDAAGLDGASKISDDDNITIDTLQSSQQQQGLIVDGGVCTTCGADVPVRSSSLRAPVTRANRGRPICSLTPIGGCLSIAGAPAPIGEAADSSAGSCRPKRPKPVPATRVNHCC
jgi:hypothetical protein